MTKRMKGNLKNIIVVCLAVLLTVALIKTVFAATVLAKCSNDVAEATAKAERYSDIPELREDANEIYLEAQEIRGKLYNHSDWYIRWISTAKDMVRIPFVIAMIIVASWSYWYTYQLCQILKRRMARA